MLSKMKIRRQRQIGNVLRKVTQRSTDTVTAKKRRAGIFHKKSSDQEIIIESKKYHWRTKSSFFSCL